METAAQQELNQALRELTFEEGWLAYQSIIFSFVSRRIRPVEDAEDVVALVFADAYRYWRKKRGEPKLWLLGIARRKVCDALRRRRDIWEIRERDHHSDALAGFVEAHQLHDARRIVMQLREEQRDAFLMQVVDGYSIQEIAGIMRRSPAAVNSLLQRARSHIQKILIAEGGQP